MTKPDAQLSPRTYPGNYWAISIAEPQMHQDMESAHAFSYLDDLSLLEQVQQHVSCQATAKIKLSSEQG
jgi:hypothetical protein